MKHYLTFPAVISRRTVFRGALAVTAALAIPVRWSRAADAVTDNGEKVVLQERDLRELQNSVSGPVILPSSLSYDEARKLWNPGIDHHPALIVKCTSLTDIQAALQFGRTYNILTAIRCGGHNYAGTGMADGGMTIDLSPFSGAKVDAEKKVAWIKGGSLLRDLDQATVPLGLATTAGVVSHTGIGGLATGLGQGRLARKFGYTIDNIRGVQMITPDGQIRRADATENSDLYWGVRGGGGNFGIVTEFELQLHEFDPNVTSFSFTYPIVKAPDVLKTLFDLGARVPNEMSLGSSINTNDAGETTASISGTYIGTPDSAQAIVARDLAPLGEPVRQRFSAINYGRLQTVADGSLFSPNAVYNRTGFFNHVDDKIAEAIAEHGSKNTMPGTEIRIAQQGGIGNTIARDATAFPHRDTLFQCTVDVKWKDPADAGRYRKFADDSWAEIGPMGNGGFYVNVAVNPNEAEIRRAYAENYDRLTAIKGKYDPTNFLRLNVNINPTGAI